MLSYALYITRTLNWVKVDVIPNIECFFSTRKTLLHKTYSWNIANIYVSIFDNYLHFWRLMYRWKIKWTLYFRCCIILFNSIMMKVSRIYVNNIGYFIQEINIHRWKVNIHHSMLAHPGFNKISIYNYQRDWFPTFISADIVYINHPLN